MGYELWLDTGGVETAAKLWTDEFTVLTTDKSLLTAEIQEGIYDEIIAGVGKLTSHLKEKEKIREIAFIPNAHHAQRHRRHHLLCVEVHADLSRALLVKVPLTPSGLIAGN